MIWQDLFIFVKFATTPPTHHHVRTTGVYQVGRIFPKSIWKLCRRQWTVSSSWSALLLCFSIVLVELTKQPPPFAAVITFTMWVHCCVLQEGSKIVAPFLSSCIQFNLIFQSLLHICNSVAWCTYLQPLWQPPRVLTSLSLWLERPKLKCPSSLIAA